MEEGKLTDWNTSLGDCCEDAYECAYGLWCCPCLAITVSGQLGENKCFPLCDIFSFAILSTFWIPLVLPPAVLSLRASMRQRYKIKGSLCEDAAISCFCSWCSWCQMYRELRHRQNLPVIVNMETNTVNMQPPSLMMDPLVMTAPSVTTACSSPLQPGVIMVLR